MGQKEYKLYDLKSHKILTTHDVTIEENAFPFRKNHEENRYIDDDTFVETLNEVEEFISTFDSTVVDLDLGSNQDEGREEIENDVPVETNEKDTSIHFDESPNHDHSETHTCLHIEDLRSSTHFRSKPKYLEDFVTSLPPSIDQSTNEISSRPHSMS